MGRSAVRGPDAQVNLNIHCGRATTDPELELLRRVEEIPPKESLISDIGGSGTPDSADTLDAQRGRLSLVYHALAASLSNAFLEQEPHQCLELVDAVVQ